VRCELSARSPTRSLERKRALQVAVESETAASPEKRGARTVDESTDADKPPTVDGSMDADKPPTKEVVIAREATTTEVVVAVEPIGVRLPKLITVESRLPLGELSVIGCRGCGRKQRRRLKWGLGRGPQQMDTVEMANGRLFPVTLQRLTWKLVVHTLYQEKSWRAISRGLLRRLT
jgi:hypothetical protein